MIKRINTDNVAEAAQLAALLWPEHTVQDLTAELSKILRKGDSALYVKYVDGESAGFAQCQLRHDYVEGTETSPVGYLEGIFIKECFRHNGYARQLVSACEDWARMQGCQEFASDCEISNDVSLRFHMSMGFSEANRIICFTKKL